MKTPPGWDRSHLGDKGPRPINLRLLSPPPDLVNDEELVLGDQLEEIPEMEMYETISGPETPKM